MTASPYMAENEICRRYRQSIDRGEQIQILAELNCVPRQEIIRILVACGNIVCTKCEFNSVSYSCNERTREWANSEYVEPPVDWSKVAVDTKILVRTHEDSVWERRHFAKYEDGKIYAWSGGLTSWSDAGSINVSAWECAKLAESEG